MKTDNNNYTNKDISKINIALIGMPGSGKSTLGIILSKSLKKCFVDIDNEIEKQQKKSIPDIFKEYGENYFRDVESSVICKIASDKNLVISCGGGAVIRDINMQSIKETSLVIYIKRDINNLSMEGRPLSKDIEALKIIETNREPLYNKYCDIQVDNNNSVEETIKKILSILEEKYGIRSVK